jgi:hypothetical protein
MWPVRFFASPMFAARYWAKAGGSSTVPPTLLISIPWPLTDEPTSLGPTTFD